MSNITWNSKHTGKRITVPKKTPKILRDQHTHTYIAPGWEKFPDASGVALAKKRQGDGGLLSHYLGLINVIEVDVLITSFVLG